MKDPHDGTGDPPRPADPDPRPGAAACAFAPLPRIHARPPTNRRLCTPRPPSVAPARGRDFPGACATTTRPRLEPGPGTHCRWRSRHVRGSGIIQSLGPGTAHVTPFSTTVVLADLAGVLPEWSALELFSARSDREVEAIAYEIALLGQAGIDYSTSDMQYTLRALPERTFSGLQLLALMYVGFKQTHPELTDIGIDLSGPYETALTLFPRKP